MLLQHAPREHQSANVVGVNRSTVEAEERSHLITVETDEWRFGCALGHMRPDLGQHRLWGHTQARWRRRERPLPFTPM